MPGKAKRWTANQIPSQIGRRALVTRANSGIGFEIARELARKGAEVVLPARSIEKAKDAAERIRREIPGASVIPCVLDLASQASVREFASSVSSQYPGPSIDLVINNAGVMAIPNRDLTIDGFEKQFATNFLGPFALTALLYPHVQRQVASRIVIVTSAITKWTKIDFTNLQSERRYSPMWQAYGQSKLADSLFAFELHRRLSSAGSPIIAISTHPGYAITNLQTNGPGKDGFASGVVGTILKRLLSQDAYHGSFPYPLRSDRP
jgi:NAD(P)-dependent dehydrogenase (short-subunit alcohol dehydrogenase family)